jgi:ATP-dependent 26S proteasome regulatory subunit
MFLVVKPCLSTIPHSSRMMMKQLMNRLMKKEMKQKKKKKKCKKMVKSKMEKEKKLVKIINKLIKICFNRRLMMKMKKNQTLTVEVVQQIENY